VTIQLVRHNVQYGSLTGAPLLARLMSNGDSEDSEDGEGGEGGDEVGAERWAARRKSMRDFRHITMP
jgi:hypothetical protein